ncbi:MAG TPA: hypothetical protein VLS27_14160 [Gammaproteobacteria bacterium]|nr:hypothetical protein [Gammaproteobacteria bacterium]
MPVEVDSRDADSFLDRLENEFPDSAYEAQHGFAESLMEEEAKPITPFESGELRGSGRVHTSSGGDDIDTEFSFGKDSGSEVYASIQHSREDFAHDPPEQDHFLEEPMRDAEDRFESEMDQAAQRAIDRADR